MRNGVDFLISFKLGEYDVFYTGLGMWNFCYDDKDWSIDYTVYEASDIINKCNELSENDKYFVRYLMHLDWENSIMTVCKLLDSILYQENETITNKCINCLKKINFKLQVR